MKVLVTGGSGFVGRNLVKKLIEENHEVTITTSGSEPDIEGVSKTLYMGLEGIDFNYLKDQEVVFHLMANNDTLCNDVEEMYRANLIGPKNIFYNLLKNGCKKFIYASSTAVYGAEPAPYVEDVTAVNPLNIYGHSKSDFDNFAMSFAEEHEAQVIGLRYCNIYGPGENNKGRRMSTIGQLIRQMIKNKNPKLFKFGEQKRDWVYIKDVVNANILSMESDRTGIFNIGSGESHSFNEVVQEINKVLNKNLNIEYIDCNFKEAYQDHTQCDISKAKKELGFYPKFFLRSGIKEYCQDLINSCLD